MTKTDKKLLGATEAICGLMIVGSGLLTGKLIADVESKIWDEKTYKAPQISSADDLSENPLDAYGSGLVRSLSCGKNGPIVLKYGNKPCQP